MYGNLKLYWCVLCVLYLVEWYASTNVRNMLVQYVSDLYTSFNKLSVVCLQSAHLKGMGCEMFYTIVQGSDHFCGGTDKGCALLEKDAPWIPYSFIGAVQPKPSRNNLKVNNNI